jgi:DNA-entry nuclease
MRLIKRILSFLIIVILLGAAGWFLWNNEHKEQSDQPVSQQIEQTYDIDSLPDYSGDPAVEVNGGIPAFAGEECQGEFVQKLSDLDSKGRCGVAFACVDKQHMPEGEREEIDTIKPSGWETGKYDFIDNGGFLFNRCHLIGWQLTGINAEERNLITGTRYFNMEGMLPYENQVAHYVRKTGNHVLYRVTPVFIGDELVARGVQLEAESVEDKGEGIRFNVFCYNVQPGVEIDYRTGENWLEQK